MIILTQRLLSHPDVVANFTLTLTAEERTRSRHQFETAEGQVLYLRLPRGMTLNDGDLLRSDDEILVRIVAKPEPVLVVTAPTPRELLQAAYHLGNRHVPVEIATTYLCLSPDSVLQTMLEQLGMEIKLMVAPFQPQKGAYGHHAH